MAKVTITIDDTHPGIVAAFGPNSLNNIADQFGYMEKVEKTEAELPAKVEVTKELDGETFTVMEYPEGTEMFKDNPQTRAEYTGQSVLSRFIVPALIQNFADAKRQEALKAVETELEQAHQVVEASAVIVAE